MVPRARNQRRRLGCARRAGLKPCTPAAHATTHGSSKHPFFLPSFLRTSLQLSLRPSAPLPCGWSWVYPVGTRSGHGAYSVRPLPFPVGAYSAPGG